MTASTTLPVQQTERIAILDVLRGFALFGVLISNLYYIVHYTTPPDLLTKLSLPLDGVLEQVQKRFVDVKFITLFAMLFGYGFGVLLKRLESKGIAVASFFSRRMTILFVFGLLNLCFWWADILHVYAVAGLALLLFRRASDKALLLWSIAFVFVVNWAMNTLSPFLFATEFDPSMSQAFHPQFKSTDPVDIVQANYGIAHLFLSAGYAYYGLFHSMGCILFGYWVLRKDLFGRLEEHLRTMRTVRWVGLGCFVIPWAFYFAGKAGLFANPWIYYGVFPLFQMGIVGMSLFYSTSLILLHRMGKFDRMFRLFGHVGRMSLTNYLMQSVLYVCFFYGIGLNLLGEVALRHVWAMGVGFYLVQVAFSAWWMKRFHYGPAEWVWRQLSYGRRFPIKRVALNVDPSIG